VKKLFFIEVTDTFGGEANYSWVTRHVIAATTERGAVNRFSKMSGYEWHVEGDYGDSKRYDSKSGATCFFISEFDNSSPAVHNFDTDERETKVVFRKFKEGDVIALICGTAADCRPGMVMSYQRVGQHGEVSRWLGNDLKLATPEEYAALKRELEGIYGPITAVDRLVA
jgi:hypothetical protein